jgi:hypothetical protein
LYPYKKLFHFLIGFWVDYFVYFTLPTPIMSLFEFWIYHLWFLHVGNISELKHTQYGSISFTCLWSQKLNLGALSSSPVNFQFCNRKVVKTPPSFPKVHDEVNSILKAHVINVIALNPKPWRLSQPTMVRFPLDGICLHATSF